jgi:hypothetical protein
VGPINALASWLLYFAPSLVAWYRAKHGKPISGTVGGITANNLLIGWTVIGWFLMLANAFGYDPVAWFLLRFAKHLTTSGPAPTGPQGGLPSGSPHRPRPAASAAARGAWQALSPRVAGARSGRS